MKNLRVRVKMLLSFLIVVALTLVVGGVGILEINKINADYTYAVNTHGKPLENIGLAISDLHAVRAELRAAMLFTGDPERIASQSVLVKGFLGHFEERTEEIKDLFPRADANALFTEAMAIYKDDFLPAVEKTMADAESGAPQADLVAYMVSDIKPAIDKVIGNLEQCMVLKSAMLEETSTAGDVLALTSTIIMAGMLLAAAVVSAILGFYVAGLIATPLGALTDFMKRAGGTGDITMSEEDVKTIEEYVNIKDEIGECIGATAAFVRHVTEVSKALDVVAGGDLTAELAVLSDNDVMGVSLNKMTAGLNKMFGEIHVATEQVATGSNQIADGAQTLAQGSSEQAATVEELSAAIAEIADKTHQNAEMAGDAASLAATIMRNAEKGSRQMNEMTKAVGEINEASQSISRVIKVIDDIAFQTNILALNAAVEAARAGQQGKGFAVVADEVRNLAAKSAAAAKDTSELIANSMDKAELGARIAKETASSLAEIVSGITESNVIVSSIAASSEEQNSGIRQINEGIDQVAQVVQQNSATAEESAAASEELSSQSVMLDELINQFKIKEKQSRTITPSFGGRRASNPETSFTL